MKPFKLKKPLISYYLSITQNYIIAMQYIAMKILWANELFRKFPNEKYSLCFWQKQRITGPVCVFQSSNL